MVVQGLGSGNKQWPIICVGFQGTEESDANVSELDSSDGCTKSEYA